MSQVDGEIEFRIRGVCLALVVALIGCSQAGVHNRTGTDEGTRGGSSGGGNSSSGGGFSLPDAAAGSVDGPSASDATTGPCTPVTCTPAGGQYCGKIGDGCGHELDCGTTCTAAGQTCGGGGVKNLCGAPRDPNCKPITCQQMGGSLCGRVGDGCGGVLECSCAAGETCGAVTPNLCGKGTAAVCDNLCKQQMVCAAGQDTTVTGTVFAPTLPAFGAADPLYNALVYVPNRPIDPFPAGVSCETCGAAVSGSPLVTALSGPDGKFILKNVPVGDNIPLVIQIGRWRRQVTIPKVAPCTATTLPAELTRLPRTQAEGNIPQLAIATGTWDPFECVLRKIGVADSEFTVPSGPGRVHIYAYGGEPMPQPTPSGTELVSKPDNLARYDLVVLPCDDESQKAASEAQNLVDYSSMGGRLFMTDYSYSWLRDAPIFHGRETWLPDQDLVGENFDALVDQSFPKGQAFAAWLGIVGASQTVGRLPIHDPYGGNSYFDGVVAPTQRWLYTETPIKTAQHFTFNTPVDAPPDKQCGRVVFSTFHVADDTDDPNLDDLFNPPPFPKRCTTKPMTPQEKAIEFMLFDASACVLPDTDRPRVFEPPPAAPPPPPPTID